MADLLKCLAVNRAAPELVVRSACADASPVNEKLACSTPVGRITIGVQAGREAIRVEPRCHRSVAKHG